MVPQSLFHQGVVGVFTGLLAAWLWATLQTQLPQIAAMSNKTIGNKQSRQPHSHKNPRLLGL